MSLRAKEKLNLLWKMGFNSELTKDSKWQWQIKYNILNPVAAVLTEVL